jgi:Cys-rich repeat protein
VQCLANSDCGAGAPICDPGEFQCRAGCTDDAQCKAPTPRCNTALSRCVECSTAADCPATAKACNAEGRCVACATNADCAAPTPLCDTNDLRRCVQCLQDRDCTTAGATKCEKGTCIAKN